MKNLDKIKSLNAREMANFLKKVSCPQYDLLVGDWSCSMCNMVIQCEEEWDKYIQDYIDFLDEEYEE